MGNREVEAAANSTRPTATRTGLRVYRWRHLHETDDVDESVWQHEADHALKDRSRATPSAKLAITRDGCHPPNEKQVGASCFAWAGHLWAGDVRRKIILHAYRIRKEQTAPPGGLCSIDVQRGCHRRGAL